MNASLPWSLDLTTTAPAASPNIVAQGDGDSITCRITVDDVVKDERTTTGLNAQTFCLVKSRMTNTHVGAHPMIPRFIRLFSVPILLGWLAVVVLVNVIAPQLESGRRGACGLAGAERRAVDAGDAARRHDFQEFDSNSSAMIVLEGDQPLGDEAHEYYDGLIDKLEADRSTSSTSRTSGATR